MSSSVEQAFVGREEIRASLKAPAWEASKMAARSDGSDHMETGL